MNTAAVSQAAAEQKLSQEELELARVYLKQTENGVVGATKGLSDAQWRFKPSADRWSIAENLYHMVIVQERVLGPVLDQLGGAGAPPAGVDCRTIDAIVIHQFPTRLAKFPAPEFVRPNEEIAAGELLERLARNYATMHERLETTAGLRQHAMEAAPLKAVSKGTYTHLDGYQWILAAAAHTERHTKQMLEVMAEAEYPV